MTGFTLKTENGKSIMSLGDFSLTVSKDLELRPYHNPLYQCKFSDLPDLYYFELLSGNDQLVGDAIYFFSFNVLDAGAPSFHLMEKDTSTSDDDLTADNCSPEPWEKLNGDE